MDDISFKVVIPMAGLGSRLRPQTWSKPKQLVGVAGKAAIDHVLDTLHGLPNFDKIELVNIVGYLGDQIKTYLTENYPHIQSHFVLQEDPRGQSHAIQLAREYLHGPMLVVFADTLIETDLACLNDPTIEAMTWVKPVPDPRRFGVAEVDDEGWVRRLVEKPQDMDNNLVMVGFYYFREAEDLLAAIDEQMERDVQLKGEYYLADAVNIMLEHGLKMRTCTVDTWLDAGTPEALLETNRYLLDKDSANSEEAADRPGVVIVPPVFIHPTAKIEHSVIGPHASIGANCTVRDSIIRDSILEDEASTSNVILESSLIGRNAEISRRPGVINAGDNSVVTL
jgi:glucose-1-phosphate thymidylyltransferase